VNQENRLARALLDYRISTPFDVNHLSSGACADWVGATNRHEAVKHQRTIASILTGRIREEVVRLEALHPASRFAPGIGVTAVRGT